jgi:iron complex outermembrane receptor protein
LKPISLKLFFLLFIFLATGNNKAHCQSTSGKIWGIVVDINGNSIPFATVKLALKNDHRLLTICDSSGKYAFFINNSLDSVSFLQAFYLKFSSEKEEITLGNRYLKIIILDTATQLKEVDIHSDEPLLTRKADRFVFVPGTNLSKGANILDVIRHTPLIDFNDKSDQFSIINRSETEVYINNKKTKIPKEMLLEMLRSLPASDIKNIEIITNPGAEYSANTLGGVININLNKRPYEGWLGNLALQSQQGKYNTTILNGSVNFRKDKLAIQLIPFFNRSYNYFTQNEDFAYTNLLDQKNVIDHFRRYLVLGGGVNADYDLTKKSTLSAQFWRTNVYGNTTQNETTNYSNLQSLRVDSTTTSPYTGSDFYTYNFANLNYHMIFDSLGTKYLDINVDYNHFFQRRENTGSINDLSPGTDIPISSDDYYDYLPQNFDNLSERAEYGTNILQKIKMTTGLQFSNTTVRSNLKYYDLENTGKILDPSLSDDYFYNEKYEAAFITFNADLSKKVSASLGVRAEATQYTSDIENTDEKIDSAYLNVFPTAGLSYSLNPDNQFGLSSTRKIIRPDIELLFPGRTYNSSNFYTENNPFLQPSLIYNNEFSYVYKNKYSIDITYSIAENSYSQFIIPISQNLTDQFQQTYLNYGTSKNLAIVLNLSQTIFKNIWDAYLTPYYNFGTFNGTVPAVNLKVSNHNFNFIYDNSIYLSQKGNLTAFVTFKYFGTKNDLPHL